MKGSVHRNGIISFIPPQQEDFHKTIDIPFVSPQLIKKLLVLHGKRRFKHSLSKEDEPSLAFLSSSCSISWVVRPSFHEFSFKL
jgi:hypothetical protein